ncbi:hypothetical protein [Nocardia mexicana]|uniref:Uncharacterized protein n=1 Tax=Nocardia mexicana TaxID=279262 RepID=A0A370H228_9NOCA|nr:hypothetical protein [Nocardia mexicana]RDI49887.1 hypothetical protein DFR68_106325 [Nocardia mexicana]
MSEFDDGRETPGQPWADRATPGGPGAGPVGESSSGAADSGEGSGPDAGERPRDGGAGAGFGASADEHRHDDHLGEFTEEMRLLAEAVLERVEPVLRRAAADGRADWGGCSWCPICAAAALVRGEHHDVVAAIAEHGTAVVTVLREALAGVPVDPVAPENDAPQSASRGPTSSAARTGGSGYVSIPVQIKV